MENQALIPSPAPAPQHRSGSRWNRVFTTAAVALLAVLAWQAYDTRQDLAALQAHLAELGELARAGRADERIVGTGHDHGREGQFLERHRSEAIFLDRIRVGIDVRRRHQHGGRLRDRSGGGHLRVARFWEGGREGGRET